MKVYKEELATGLKTQEIVLPIIKKYFKRNIKNTDGKYNRYDYTDDDYKYELKSRTNNYNKFPTTLIGLDKIQDKSIFLFYFTDGLYYIEYGKEKFAKYEIKMVEAVRKRNGVVGKTLEPHFFVDIKDLIEIKI